MSQDGPRNPRWEMTHPMTRTLLAPLLLAGFASPAHADCFSEGNAALGTGAYATAADAFARARARPECAADSALLTLNEAYARERIADGGGDPAAACAAATLYRGLTDAADAEVAGTARRRLDTLAPRCAAASAPPEAAAEAPTGLATGDAPAEGRIDRTAGYLLAGAVTALVGGGVVYGLAVAADAERADARADYTAALARGDEAGWEDAASRFEAARTDTNALGISGIALLTVGAGLGVAALSVGLSGDDAPSVVPDVGPAGVGVSGRW